MSSSLLRSVHTGRDALDNMHRDQARWAGD